MNVPGVIESRLRLRRNRYPKDWYGGLSNLFLSFIWDAQRL